MTMPDPMNGLALGACALLGLPFMAASQVPCMNQRLDLTRDLVAAPLQPELERYAQYAGLRSGEWWNWDGSEPDRDTSGRGQRVTVERTGDGILLRRFTAENAKKPFALVDAEAFKLQDGKVMEALEYDSEADIAAGKWFRRHTWTYGTGTAAGKPVLNRIENPDYTHEIATTYDSQGRAVETVTRLLRTGKAPEDQWRTVWEFPADGVNEIGFRSWTGTAVWTPEYRYQYLIGPGGRVDAKGHWLFRGLDSVFRLEGTTRYAYDFSGRVVSETSFGKPDSATGVADSLSGKTWVYGPGAGEVEQRQTWLKDKDGNPGEPDRDLTVFDAACRVIRAESRSPEHEPALWAWYRATWIIDPAGLARSAKTVANEKAPAFAGADALGRMQVRLPGRVIRGWRAR